MLIFNCWESLFSKVFLTYPSANLYLTGGTVIGLCVLKDLYVNCENFDSVYKEFRNLQLINDFDFVLEYKECCTYDFYYNFGAEYNIFLNGSKPINNKKNQGNKTPLHVMRHTGNKTLFELTVCSTPLLLELPMTNMKLYLTKDNFINLLSFLQGYHENTLTNFEFLNELDINVEDCDADGLFVANDITLPFSSQIKTIINNITRNNTHLQCLQYLVQNPTNLSRLQWKNIPKANCILSLYLQYSLDIPLWLPNTELLTFLTIQFLSQLKTTIHNTYILYESELIHLTNKINKYDKLFTEYNTQLSNSADKKTCAQLKQNAKLKRDGYREKITNLYVNMFIKLNSNFEGMNMIRWKDHIEIYEKNNVDCILTYLFDFKIPLKLLDGGNVVTTSKDLFNNDIWLILIELARVYG
jgi:hypothetical protein